MPYYSLNVIVPSPAVNVVTLSDPTVVVVPVNPEPIEIVLVFGYLKITTPDPPAPPATHAKRHHRLRLQY